MRPGFSVSTKFRRVFRRQTRQFIEFVKTMGNGEGICYNIGNPRAGRGGPVQGTWSGFARRFFRAKKGTVNQNGKANPC